jgi:trans-2,3-dihydro-3-hydroxyanthranilate isomerase
MPAYRYRAVDVFTTVALEGNPLAVFTDARGLDPATMQRIARELNLSETTFVTPPSAPGATARVRIFTPHLEMPFAGHPTLGTAFVLRDDGRAGDELVLEENIGNIPVRVEHAGQHERFWLTSPPITFGARVAPKVAATALGLDEADLLPGTSPEFATVGPTFLYVALRDRGTVDRASLTSHVIRDAVPNHGPLQVFVFAPDGDGAYSRMFADEAGIVEDPATGAATGPLAAYMLRHGLSPRINGGMIVSEQGTKMGRRSLLYALTHVDGDDVRIEIGGSVVAVAEGTLMLP